MTAEEWEACDNPAPMLDVFGKGLSSRKLTLLACACSRMLWNTLPDAGRRMVAAAEARADGHPFKIPFPAGAWQVNDSDFTRPVAMLASASDWSLREAIRVARWDAARAEKLVPTDADIAAIAAKQADLAHCLFASPFRPPFTVSAAVLAHNDSTAVKLATVIYDDRDPSRGLLDVARLAILADALEEAGVEDQTALDHLRGPGPHCRGCHVVDAVLGKK